MVVRRIGAVSVARMAGALYAIGGVQLELENGPPPLPDNPIVGQDSKAS